MATPVGVLHREDQRAIREVLCASGVVVERDRTPAGALGRRAGQDRLSDASLVAGVRSIAGARSHHPIAAPNPTSTISAATTPAGTSQRRHGPAGTAGWPRSDRTKPSTSWCQVSSCRTTAWRWTSPWRSLGSSVAAGSSAPPIRTGITGCCGAVPWTTPGGHSRRLQTGARCPAGWPQPASQGRSPPGRHHSRLVAKPHRVTAHEPGQ